MGQRRTLLRKNPNNPRNTSLKKGTDSRRTIYGTAIDNGTVAVVYSFHTTKGRMHIRVVPSTTAEVAE